MDKSFIDKSKFMVIINYHYLHLDYNNKDGDNSFNVNNTNMCSSHKIWSVRDSGMHFYALKTLGKRMEYLWSEWNQREQYKGKRTHNYVI